MIRIKRELTAEDLKDKYESTGYAYSWSWLVKGIKLEIEPELVYFYFSKSDGLFAVTLNEKSASYFWEEDSIIDYVKENMPLMLECLVESE